MTTFALSLVLASSVLHATWNLLAKRAGGGAAFVWLVAAASATLYAPAVVSLIVLRRPVLGGPQLLLMAGTGLLHVGYYLALEKRPARRLLPVRQPRQRFLQSLHVLCKR